MDEPMPDDEFVKWLAGFQTWLEEADKENAEWVSVCRSGMAGQSELAITPEEVAELCGKIGRNEE